MEGKLFVRTCTDHSHAQEIKRVELSLGEFAWYQPFEFHLEMFFPYTLADLRGGNCTYSIEIMGSVTLDEIAGIKDYHKFIHTGTERNMGVASESGCAEFVC